ncbi:MAG: RNA polymerase sigma factor [Acidobacteria bacterium]|nr:MAG: RNA polymerase sigma factor [Acidobacteriota bacterium]
MEAVEVVEKAKAEKWPDEEVVARILQGETALFEIIMRRYNQRLFRVALGILRDEAEAEDVAQDAYVRAYQHLSQFAGRAAFSTWLTRIAVHEALARAGKRKQLQSLEGMVMLNGNGNHELTSHLASPEQQASTAEIRNLMEAAILSLPEVYRVVLMLRDIEEMNTAETASALNLTEENVKVRLHRARVLLRRELYNRADAARGEAFPFMGARCDRLVQRVFERLAGDGLIAGEGTKRKS